MANKLAEKVLWITTNYLGPEARRFLDRQVGHMKVKVAFDELKEENLEELSWWLFVSGKLIMKKDRAREMADVIANLAKAKV